MFAATDARRHNERFFELLTSRTWIRRVRIIRAVDACASCLQGDAIVDVHEIPDLPNPYCQTSDGCRCWLMPAPRT
jgi:hypothetical protein